MKRRLKKSVRLTIMILLLILGISTVGHLYYEASLKSNFPKSEDYISVEIPMGTSLRKVSSILKEKNLIKNDKTFLLYAKLNNLENIKSGNYTFEIKDDVPTILSKLNTGDKPLGEKITIPEGFEAIDIANKLSNLNLVNKDLFMNLVHEKNEFTNNYPFLVEEDINSLEGYLYPDTYFITKEMGERDVIEMFLSRFNEIYEENHLDKELKNKGITLNEFLTMASIVEREAVLDEERPIIAGVFYNRLKLNMPLQSCATVQYILKERKPVLSIEDTKIDSPYNTYHKKGLPPSPIASPGLKSMLATLSPEKTNYIYFLAKGDGGHEFSETYEDHLLAKKKFLGN